MDYLVDRVESTNNLTFKKGRIPAQLMPERRNARGLLERYFYRGLHLPGICF